MKLVYTLAIALGLTAGPLFAQSSDQEVSDTTDVELTRSVIQAEKKMIVAANVDLTEEESQGFWPIYNDYQNETRKLNDRLLALIEDFAANYEAMTDAKAKSLLEEAMAIETDELALKNSYMPKFAKVLPAKKLTQYYQVENKLKAIIDYDLASAIPLVK